MRSNRALQFLMLISLLCFYPFALAVTGWEGKSSNWEGFERFDFEVDGRPCYVVIPGEAAPGKPWVWRARFPSFHTGADLLLLERGFHIAHMDTGGMLGSPRALKHWDAFYAFMTQKHGMAVKPALEAVSRGGLFAYGWAARNPERVACIYADTPVCDIKSWPLGSGKGVGHANTWKNLLEEYSISHEQGLAYKKNPVDILAPIAAANIPLLHIVSLNDRVVPPAENTFLLAKRYRELGGSIEIMEVDIGTEKSQGHHFTHPSPERVAGFIKQHTQTVVFPDFNRVGLLETTSETSANVEVGDLNGDGNLDVVLGKGRHWPLVNRVFPGDGKGGFPESYDLSGDSDRTYSGELADLDGDGDLDVVVSNDKPDKNYVYLNDGRGNFQVASTFGESSWGTRYVCVADMNGDSLPDIIVANRMGYQGGFNYICVNNGGGVFNADCIPFSDYSSTTITPADFNNDGLIDLAVPHRDGGQSFLFLQTGLAEFDFKKIPFGPSDASIRMSQAADFNGDGTLDLVTIDTNSGVKIYFQDERGAFTSKMSFGNPPSMPYALLASDLNQDGLFDFVVGYRESKGEVYFNKGSGKSFAVKQFGDGKGSVYGFAVGDMDNDGQTDIACARSGALNVVYFGSL